MSDTDEIRDRLDAAKRSIPYEMQDRHKVSSQAWSDLYFHAPSDLKFLIDKVDNMNTQVGILNRKLSLALKIAGLSYEELTAVEHGAAQTFAWGDILTDSDLSALPDMSAVFEPNYQFLFFKQGNGLLNSQFERWMPFDDLPEDHKLVFLFYPGMSRVRWL